MVKKLLMLLVLLAVALPAHATRNTATFGDRNSSNVYRVAADTNGTITFASDTSILYPYKTETTNDTLTAYDTGKTIVFTGSLASIMTLPTAAPGMEFTLISNSNKLVSFDPQITDTIAYATIPLSAGDKLTSAGATADSVTLFCPVAGTWSVKAMKGTWIDGN